MSRPLLRSVLLASAGLASALLASCEEGGGPPAPAPAASLPTSTADSAHPTTEIPAPFQGEWNLRLEDCGGRESDGRLVIAGQELELHESRGEVVSVEVAGDTLTVSAAMSGEGETWEEVYRFRLSPDGQALQQPVSQDDEGVRRLRCPRDIPR